MASETLSVETLEKLEHQPPYPRFLRIMLAGIGVWFITNPFPDHWAAQALWTTYTAYILFSMTSLFHECVHQTAYKSVGKSVWMGRIIGTIVGIPYHVYREAHIRHHGYLNKPGDFELWPYSDPNAGIWFRRAFVWFDIVCGAIASPIIYGRIFWSKHSPIKKPELRATIRKEYLGIVVFWAALIGLVALTDSWYAFLMMWVIPHTLAGIFQTFRKLTEHLGMESYDPLHGTRTVIGTNWFTRLCNYLHYDIFIHGLHHRHPRVTHSNLLGKMRDYMEESPETQFPVYTSYWKATAAMLPWIFVNPGVGMNRGATDPEAKVHPDVQDFVSDVTEEVLDESERITADTLQKNGETSLVAVHDEAPVLKEHESLDKPE